MKDIDQALLEAASNGNLETVQCCLENGADVNATEIDGWTALHYAAMKGREPIVRALIQAGADIETRSITGWTALHCAARNGHELVIKVLLKSGANIDARANSGCSALFYAALHGKESAIAALIQSGAECTPDDRKMIERYKVYHTALQGVDSAKILSLIDSEIASRELRELSNAELDNPPDDGEPEVASKPMRL